MAYAPSSSADATIHRALVAEAATRAATYAAHAASYADLGDDAGLARSVRLMTTAAVRAAEALPALAEAARQDQALRDAARAARG